MIGDHWAIISADRPYKKPSKAAGLNKFIFNANLKRNSFLLEVSRHKISEKLQLLSCTINRFVYRVVPV